MPYRAMALVAASLLFATQCYAETTTVKSSKSNTSDRMGGGGGGKGAVGKTSVRPGVTNTTTGGDRMGAVARGPRGGVAAVGRTTVVRPDKGAVQLNPQPEPPGKTK